MSDSLSKRVVLIVLDGVGVGALPDASAYGDDNADTLRHVAEACGGLALPHLQAMGLGNLVAIPGVPPVLHPTGAFGRMRECSGGKDSTTGHWEMAGVIQKEPFPAFPTGFPEEVIEAFRKETGLAPLGNVAASGTEIIREMGEEHFRTGRPIVYTSADSVFQIAAHEDVIPVERLYEICRLSRKILDPWRIGRVIARPFTGASADSFRRTSRRHDFSLPPTGETILDRLTAAGIRVCAVGKISDIFTGRGISESVATENNADGMSKTLEALQELDSGLIFTNLIDFDMEFGHRLDAQGFGAALEAFDRWLPRVQNAMSPGDLLLISADHGCDPTTPGTDHSREYVPVMAWRCGSGRGGDLGERRCFTDIAATVAEYFGLEWSVGESFLSSLPLSADDRGRREQADASRQKGRLAHSVPIG